jgi:hypothetical protein
MIVIRNGKEYFIVKGNSGSGMRRLLLENYGVCGKGKDTFFVGVNGITLNQIRFPKELLGQRVRIKVEIVDVPGEHVDPSDIQIDWDAKILGKHRQVWDEQDEAFLKENVTRPVHELASILQRTEDSVRLKMKSLGVWSRKRKVLRVHREKQDDQQESGSKILF